MATDAQVENHRRTMDNLDKSAETVWMVARWLQGTGFPVTVNPTFKTPDYEHRMEYVDGGDLFIQQRIEVKGSGTTFSCADDFPYDDAIVCAKHSFDNAKPRPFAYVIVSACKKHAMIVLASSHKKWVSKRLKDKTKVDYEQDFYLIPKQLAVFKEL